MRKILLSIMALMMFLSSNAESREQRVSNEVKSALRATNPVTCNSKSKSVKYLFEYDTVTICNSDGSPSRRVYCKYDANYNKTLALYEDFTEGNFVYNGRGSWTYDLNNNMLTALSEYYIGGEWVGDSRWLFTYDEKGVLLSESFDYYLDGEWVSDDKTVFTYYDNGNLESRTYMVFESWGSGEWMNSTRLVYSYDDKGNLKEYFTYSWSSTDNDWVLSTVNQYTYDKNDLVTLELIFSYSDGESTPNMRVTFDRDSEGKLLVYTVEFYNEDKEELEFSSREDYKYDEAGNKVEMIYKTWSEGQWEYMNRYRYAYDANANVISYNSDMWFDGVWENGMMNEYEYDANNNRISYKASNFMGDEWSVSETCNWTYDENNNSTLLESTTFAPFFRAEIFYNNMASSYVLMIMSDESIIKASYIETNKVGVAERESSCEVNCYPNPAKTVVHVGGINEGDMVSIMDLSGKTLIQTASSSINVESLKAGVYLLTVDMSTGSKVVKKLVIK